MVEFLWKFENRGIKIVRVNSIIITKYVDLELFTFILFGIGVRCDWRRFSVLSPFIEKSMQQYIGSQWLHCPSIRLHYVYRLQFILNYWIRTCRISRCVCSSQACKCTIPTGPLDANLYLKSPCVNIPDMHCMNQFQKKAVRFELFF